MFGQVDVRALSEEEAKRLFEKAKVVAQKTGKPTTVFMDDGTTPVTRAGESIIVHPSPAIAPSPKKPKTLLWLLGRAVAVGVFFFMSRK
jgi:hypothetical protein